MSYYLDVRIMITYTHYKTAVTLLLTGFTLLLIVLAGISRSEVNDWGTIMMRLFLFIIVYNGSLMVLRRFQVSTAKVIAEISLILAAIGFIYKETDPFQHIFVGQWQDASFIKIEYLLFGTEINRSIQSLYHPYLTEAMMFSYVVYIVLLPLVAYLCFRSGGMKGMYEYLFLLVASYILCYGIFLIYPIASPVFYQPEYYAFSFKGGFFTRCAELLHVNQHYPGGAFPSPHCAAATVMMLMMYRYNRNLFYLTLPTILLIYISTVYGGFHYVFDSIAGIGVAVFCWKYAPFFLKAFDGTVQQVRRLENSFTERA
jgi:membrane-associated phospholipid phosphatase